ncbi:MAG TPA: phosphoribosylanthranilate isomerase [Acidobacteriota bacterium]|nr:phosphoribosylanthranilate isomerase [Acidobacteriota bacterium]
MIRFKVCCIQSVEEAWLAIRYGASALGLVSAMPSGPGPIPEELIAEIAAAVPPGVATFLLTSLRRPEEIIAQQRLCRTNTVQLCDSIFGGANGYRRLRKAMPGIGIVKVVHVTGEEAIAEALAVAPHVDAILLDSGNPRLKVKELGGTGRTHDWALSRRIRDAASVPLYLAGGLNPDNVAEAIRQVKPFAVDVCSGLRTNGILDESLLNRFAGILKEG